MRLVEELLPGLLKANQENWEMIFPTVDHGVNGRLKLIRDYRAIRFGIGQRSGASAAISKLALRTDIVISVAPFEDYYPNLLCPLVGSVESLVPGTPTRIWVDGASIWNTSLTLDTLRHIVTSCVDISKLLDASDYPQLILIN